MEPSNGSRPARHLAGKRAAPAARRGRAADLVGQDVVPVVWEADLPSARRPRRHLLGARLRAQRAPQPQPAGGEATGRSNRRGGALPDDSPLATAGQPLPATCVSAGTSPAAPPAG